MGLDIEHSRSSTTVADAEDESESTPLQPWPAQELNASTTDSQQSEADEPHEVHQAQGDQGNDYRNHEDRDALSNPQPSIVKRMSLLNIWWLEMIACLLVLAMIGALVGTIYPYQGQPLPHWPYTLSINSIVAFYAEVMRVAMILVLGECLSQLKWSWFTQPRPLDHIEHYDNASRGPWGSLGLLWAIRMGALLPSIGGIMMILTLLLVPFTQQIVQFYSCSVPDPTLNASIPKTNFASAGASMHIGAGLNSIEPHVQAIMNSGIYDSQLKEVTFDCPSGNCTFEGIYHSMGWCSHCMDISDQLEIIREPTPFNFTLPSSNLTATAGIRTFVMGMGQQKSYHLPIQAILGWDNSEFMLSDSPWGKRGYGAAECSIDPCVRSYTSTVKGGNLTETLVSTSETWTDGEYWLNSINVPCLNDAEKSALRDAGYDFSPDDTTWLAYNLSATAEEAFNPTVLNSTNTTIRPECIYQTYIGEVHSLSIYLGSMFSGELAFAPNVLGGPPILQTLFQEGNVTFYTIEDAFSRLAQALTVWTREKGGNVVGQVYRSDTCVSARWGWLAYPLSLVLITMVFLVWTIDHTRRQEGSGQDYKSSPLAFLFHRLGDVGTEGPTSCIENRAELKKKAETMKVVFQGQNRVWRFIEVDQSDHIEAIK